MDWLGEPYFQIIFGLITGLIGLAKLLQVQDALGRSRPILRLSAGQSAGEVILRNVGSTAALGLEFQCGGETDVLDALPPDTEIKLRVPPSLGIYRLCVTFRSVWGRKMWMVREIKVGHAGELRVISGEDRIARLKWPSVTGRIRYGDYKGNATRHPQAKLHTHISSNNTSPDDYSN